MDDAPEEPVSRITEAKKQREEKLRQFCLDLATVVGVNDEANAIIYRANEYYKFIKKGLVP